MNKLIEKPISFGGQVISGKGLHRIRPCFILNEIFNHDSNVNNPKEDWGQLFELYIDLMVYPHSLYFSEEYKVPEGKVLCLVENAYAGGELLTALPNVIEKGVVVELDDIKAVGLFPEAYYKESSNEDVLEDVDDKYIWYTSCASFNSGEQSCMINAAEKKLPIYYYGNVDEEKNEVYSQKLLNPILGLIKSKNDTIDAYITKEAIQMLSIIQKIGFTFENQEEINKQIEEKAKEVFLPVFNKIKDYNEDLKNTIAILKQKYQLSIYYRSMYNSFCADGIKIPTMSEGFKEGVLKRIEKQIAQELYNEIRNNQDYLKEIGATSVRVLGCSLASYFGIKC